MKPGPDIVLACPQCEAPIVHFTLASGNTIGAQIWTDGKMMAPMLPQLPAITKCKNCAQYFWLHKARKLGEIPLWGEGRENIPAKWKVAQQVGELTEAEYLEALGRGLAINRDQEIHLRTEAWRAGNDLTRFSETLESSTRDDESSQNLHQLSILLDESIPRERIIKAEVMRNLGNFKESLRLLVFDFPQDYHQAVTLIRACAINRDKKTREIKEDHN